MLDKIKKDKDSKFHFSDLNIDSELIDEEKEFEDTLAIIMDLQRQLEHSLELNSALQEEVENLRTNNRELESLSASHAREIERFQEEKASYQTEAECLIAELSESEDERSEVIKEITKLKEDIESRDESIHSLREELSGMLGQFDASRRKAETREQKFQEKISHLEGNFRDSQEHLQEKIHVLHEMNGMVESAERKKAQLEKTVNYLRQNRVKFGKIHESLRSVQNKVLKHKE